MTTPMTRRRVLEIAAAFAGAQAAPPFAVSAEEAAALLDAPMAPVPEPPFRPVSEPELHDPVAFAVGLDGLDTGAIYHQAPADYAAYRQALDALIREMPVLRHVPFDHPLTRLDEAAGALACASWMAGVRAGAAYEHLRLALLSPTRPCPRCHGHGRLWDGSPHRRDVARATEEGCPDCDGRGVVPTPPARLAGLAAD